MSNFKVGNSKFSRFVNGKGFYIALALCLVAIGTAAYIAVNSSNVILNNAKSTSGASSKATTTSSIPNWDTQNSAAQTNTTVSGVAPDKRRSSPASAASSKLKASSVPAKHKSSGSKAKIVYTMPVSSPKVITAYSGNNLVYDKTMCDYRVHGGVDIGAADGTPVKACASGTVSDVKVDSMLGQEIIINHGDGIKSIYANMASQVSVKKGQKVEVGDTIGAVGKTAQAETALAPHLHFEITKNGTDVDPLATITDQN